MLTITNYLKKFFIILILFNVLILSFESCKKTDTVGGSTPPQTPIAKSNEAKLLTFDFKSNANTSLVSDVKGTINETNKTIILTIPPNTLQTSLIATFTNSSKSTVKIGTTVQVSSTTANNFTTPIIYTVIAEDGTEGNYTVSVIDPSSQIRSITLQSNTQLMIADGISKPTLTVNLLDANGVNVPNIPYQLYANNIQISSNSFTTNQEGSYIIYAKINNVESNKITIQARQNIQYSMITIPVIFHIVHFGEAIGTGTNLTSTQVNSILDNLNKGFSNLYNSVNPNAVDTKVRFRLAIYDKNNSLLTEPGIFRVNGTPYDDGGRPTGGPDIPNDKKLGPNEWGMMKDFHFNPSEYLNIWLGPEQYGRGSATLPFVFSSKPLGGLVTLPDNFVYTDNNPWVSDPWVTCKLNTASALFSTSLIHEVGHVLGLMHPMSIDNCVTSDYCSDTYSYVYDSPTQPCGDNKGTLSSETFMDYRGSYNTFTYDQRERIRHVLNHALWLKDLKNSNK